MNFASASPKYVVLLPCRWGWFVGMKADPFQTGSVATQGEWAPNESAIVRSFLRPGDTAIDVGANVGNLTLAMSSAVGDSGHIMAFEPQRFCFACLCANVALNSLIHYVDVFNLAVGETTGTIDVPILNPTQEITNYGGVSLLDIHTAPVEKVAMVTIDSLELTKLRLLKADVEGMEPAVFRGARDTIKRLRPVIWTECLKTRGTREELHSIFSELDYRAWACCTGLFSAENSRGCRYNMFQLKNGDMQDHNVLALPAEAPVPDWVSKAEIFSAETANDGDDECPAAARVS